MAGFNYSGVSDALGKLAGLLDVFDMSFLVSGFVAMLGWGWFAMSLGVQLPDAGVLSFVVVGGAYVNGMVCFAAGRWFRRTVLQKLNARLNPPAPADAFWTDLQQEAPA